MQATKTSFKTPEDILKIKIAENILGSNKDFLEVVEDFTKEISEENGIPEGMLKLKIHKETWDGVTITSIKPLDLYSGFIYYIGVIVPFSVVEGLEEFTLFYDGEYTLKLVNGVIEKIS